MENLHPPGPGEWREATESHPSQRGRGRPGPHGREGKLRLKGQWRTPQACPGQQAHQGVGRGCSTHIRLGGLGTRELLYHPLPAVTAQRPQARSLCFSALIGKVVSGASGKLIISPMVYW